GRAGWNIVTSQEDETREALGQSEADILDRDARYEKAAEFAQIVTELWDSLPDEAIIADKENDVYVDTSLTHPIDVDGKYYKSAGVLPLPGRYRGERPMIFQAGVSKQSREFGARW